MANATLPSTARAVALAAERAPQADRARRLGEDLVTVLREDGLLRLGVPAALGGPEAPPAVTLGCAEEVARADASAGWCVSIASTSSLLAAYLQPDAAREVFGDPDAVAAGVWAPRGRATEAPGGLRISGRWSFCSGITHSDWLFGGCLVGEEPRIAAMPVAELEVLDTWDVAGLRGTGSHDAVADDLFVPHERTLSLFSGPVHDTPLYRFPIFGFFACSIAAAALGNARGALDDLATLAVGKTPLGSGRTLAERPGTQAALAQAEAALRAARALFQAAVAAAWEAEPATDEHRLGLRLAATHAVRTAADVARSAYDLGGGSALYEANPLARRFRDAHAATAHFQVAPATYELMGRLLLGVPSRTEQL